MSVSQRFINFMNTTLPQWHAEWKINRIFPLFETVLL